MTGEPIPLSKAHVTEVEADAIRRATLSGWVTPVGPEIDAFEADVCACTGVGHAVALSSGTAALQLGLKALGVGPGDTVIVPTLTFAATAFAVVHTGATPVFIDVEPTSWNLDPDLLAEVLAESAKRGRLPKAVVPVDLLGRTADYDRILPICREYDIPVLIDSAESLGATHGDVPAGAMGDAAIFSFNGNKIITTSGGGMLISTDRDLVEKVRYWSTQARESVPWYEHREIGYNYRMSNLLAALGRVQLGRLSEILARRAAIRDLYIELLGDIDCVDFIGDPPWGRSNNWLTCMTIDPDKHGAKTLWLQERLAEQSIEVRMVWKPMHQQPVFADAESHLTGVADEVFATGLLLPSGGGLTDHDIARVAAAVRELL